MSRSLRQNWTNERPRASWMSISSAMTCIAGKLGLLLKL